MGTKIRLIFIMCLVGIITSCNNTALDKKEQGPLFKDVYSDSSCKFYFVYGSGGDYICKYMSSGNCCDKGYSNIDVFIKNFIQNIDSFLINTDSIKNRKVGIEFGCTIDLSEQINLAKELELNFPKNFRSKIENTSINIDGSITFTFK